jgi:hypothetical protein
VGGPIPDLSFGCLIVEEQAKALAGRLSSKPLSAMKWIRSIDE